MLFSKKMLQVVKTAWEMLESAEDVAQVEVLWISAITGLRAIGHILSKTDKTNHPEYADGIDSWWTNLKVNKHSDENRIFFDFIENERNYTLKEFLLNFEKNPQHIAVISESSDNPIFEKYILDDLLYIPLTSGPYEGEDIRDMIAEAIDWWELQFGKMGL